MAMPLRTLAPHLALQQFQGREQRGRAIALVIMGQGSAASLLHRKPGLRAIQSLDLALFIDAQHHRLLRWIQIQTDHVGQFLQKARIARKLERFHPMRFQIMAAPDVVYRRLAYSQAPGQQAATPLALALGFRLQGGVDDFLDLLWTIAGFSSPPGSDLPQTRQPLLRPALAP